jgi:hypothetical protein
MKKKKDKHKEEETYLKYPFKKNDITIYVENGGTLIFQSGNPTPPPKPPRP